MATLIIRETSIPDLDDPDEAAERGYVSYGRFARLNSGGLWFGDVRSTHPESTQAGWFWAFDEKGDLLVSSSGSSVDAELLFSGDRAVLAWLLEELVKRRLLKKPEGVKIERA
jgi:hypothetical protein